jgi:hypothetical protein
MDQAVAPWAKLLTKDETRRIAANLRTCWNSKSVLNLAVRRSGDPLSMNERAHAVTHHARK